MMDSEKKTKHQHCKKVFNRTERPTNDIGETCTFDEVRDRLLRNNELYLIQWGAQVNAVLKEGIIHEESLTFEDRHALNLFRKQEGKDANAGNVQTSRSANYHACPHCDYSCKVQTTLRRHIREVHVKEKLYSCGSCDKSFSRRWNRDSHMKTCSIMDVYTFSSCIRRHHVKNFWLPVWDDLLSCVRDENNKDDPTSVAIMCDDLVAGYVPNPISYIYTGFLRNGTIKARITGSFIDGGYGTEVPVDYIFNGPRKDICRVIHELNNIKKS